jgi:hypothetical protein
MTDSDRADRVPPRARRGPRAAADRHALLRRAAQRAAARPAFLAASLLPYAQAEGLDDAALAARLGCAPDALARLLLCRQPRPEPAAFRADVARLADAFALDPVQLASVLRTAAALAALREPTAGTGQLAAARDRPPDPAPAE